MNLAGVILLAAGVFSVCGAVCDWDWFINSRKARAMVALLGRNGARGVYGLLGAVLSVVGLLSILGVVDLAESETRPNQTSPFGNPVSSSGTTSAASGKPAVPQKTPEELEREAVLAAQAQRPDNSNPAAYTKDGGRRSDDPEPVLLPDAARGNGEVNIQINGLWGAGWDWYVHKRVIEMVSAKQMRGQFRQGFAKLTFAGVSDLEALAKIIDFGTVTSIDTAARLIEVKADPARLPKPQRVIESPREKVPGFESIGIPEPEYSLNELLSGLTHWHPDSRQAACIRLGVLKSLPETDRPQVIEAVQRRQSDQDFSVRMAADRAVGLLQAATK